MVKFDEVLLVAMGKIPCWLTLNRNAEVIAEVIEHGRGKKIKIIKFKRRKHHLKHQGHRQAFTAIKITGIEALAFNQSKRSKPWHIRKQVVVPETVVIRIRSD